MHPTLSIEVFSRKINVKFMKIDGFESKRQLENFLLVFDDSYEDIHNDNEFFGQATKGRHRWIDEIKVKLNLFQHSQWSRTIDLNTSHILLFKSPRDVQQVDLLGLHLNITKHLRTCYKVATRQSHENLLINLSTRTLDCLGFCSSVTQLEQTVFLLKAGIIPITNEKEKLIFSAAYDRT